MIHWNVSPELLSLGPIQIRWYGMLFAVGFTLGYRGMQRVCRIEKISEQKLDSLLWHLIIGTVIGARLGHCLFYDPSYYLSNPIEILKIWEGGLASHGGVTGVIIALWLFHRKNPEFKIFWLLDRISIFTAMTGGFIRLGNLMNSEILGRPTQVPWAFVFERVDRVPRHPVQIYESMSYFAIFAIDWAIYKRYKAKPPGGLIFGVSLILVFLTRFVLEFFKENQESFESGLPINMGQILSLPFIAIGAYLVYRALRGRAN